MFEQQQQSIARSVNRLGSLRKLHWHVMFTHFPISLFLMSSLFMVLHMFTDTRPFEMAGFVSLLAGFVTLVPTTVSGWWTWKAKYKGAMTSLFKYKINMSIAMIAACVVLIVARAFLVNSEHTLWHWIYAAGLLLLFIGSLTEGHYGGKLNHR